MLYPDGSEDPRSKRDLFLLGVLFTGVKTEDCGAVVM
jgi:hypothetical protein